MNLALEKGERVTTGGKGRGEIGGEAGEITGVVADAPTTDGLGAFILVYVFIIPILFSCVLYL